MCKREPFPADSIFGPEDDGVCNSMDFFYAGCPSGSLVQTPDGRVWTVVYHNLDGYGVIEGDHPQFIGADDEQLVAHTHLLRKPWKGHDKPCIGEWVKVLRRAPKKQVPA